MLSKFSLKIAIAGFCFAALTLIVVLYIFRDIKYGIFNTPAILFVCLLGLALFYIWVDNNQTVLIRAMDEMVKSFARGNMHPRFVINKDDELGHLNESLHQMACILENRMAKTMHEKDQMETILASMVEGVLAFDITGRLLMMNKTAEEMIGVNFREVENRFFLEVIRNYQLSDLLQKCLSDGLRQVIEVKITSADPEYYRIYITPIVSKDVSKGVIVVLRNVTEVRLLEQVRSDFVANVSHELRTPLTSIKGYVETLLDGEIENIDNAQRFLTVINKETDRLNRLINDLLYLSMIETGRVEIAKKWIDAQELIDRVSELLQPVAAQKNITIESEISAEARVLYGSPDMLEQVMINVVENAVKYSYEGGTVRILIETCEQGRCIKVIDRGIGIPSENLARIFERFYRVDKGRSRKAGGTGLGLSIVKHIVERHRGHVQVESEEDKGTTFTIILPVN